LEHPDGRRYTVNVEYNQLDPLLKASLSLSLYIYIYIYRYMYIYVYNIYMF
jgi:hypothetical protein